MRHKKIQTFSYSHLCLYYNMSLTFDINKKNNRSFPFLEVLTINYPKF